MLVRDGVLGSEGLSIDEGENGGEKEGENGVIHGWFELLFAHGWLNKRKTPNEKSTEIVSIEVLSHNHLFFPLKLLLPNGEPLSFMV